MAFNWIRIFCQTDCTRYLGFTVMSLEWWWYAWAYQPFSIKQIYIKAIHTHINLILFFNQNSRTNYKTSVLCLLQWWFLNGSWVPSRQEPLQFAGAACDASLWTHWRPQRGAACWLGGGPWATTGFNVASCVTFVEDSPILRTRILWGIPYFNNHFWGSPIWYPIWNMESYGTNGHVMWSFFDWGKNN